MQSRHDTLTAATVATVTLTGPFDEIEIVNRDGSAEIYFTRDGTVPTVAGNNTEVLPAVVGGVSLPGRHGNLTVKLISSGTPTYSVIGR